MGMPAAAAKEWTVEMLETLPDDGKRYEIIDGELIVSPSPRPRHQEILWKLVVLVDAFIQKQPLWYGLTSPVDVIFSPRNVLQPDLFLGRRTALGKAIESIDTRSLALAIEILSPSTARYDRNLKRKLYQRFKVPEYWIVDPDARLVERWKPEDVRPEILTDSIEWHPPGEGPSLNISLPELSGAVEEEPK
jgi:Uma2 family endonuclease